MNIFVRILRISFVVFLSFLALAFILVYGTVIIVNIQGISDHTAIDIINRDLNSGLSEDSAHIVYKEYDTNLREEGYIIVCDLTDEDTENLYSRFTLTSINKSILSDEKELNRYYSEFLSTYFNDEETVYYRYAYNQLINGEEHVASSYLIVLSPKGRLLLCVDQ